MTIMSDAIRIQFSPVYCNLIEPVSEELHQELYQTLAYRSEGYYFSPAYQSGVWDGYTRLYQLGHKRFLSGLLKRVVSFLEEKGYQVAVEGFPQHVPFNPKHEHYKLRGYQHFAAMVMTRERFGILQAPPRTGKTLLMVAVTDSERSFPTVIFCRSLDLAYQTIQRFEQFLPEVKVGLIGDGVVDIQDVTIVTIQSAYSAYDKKCPEKKLKKEKEIENKLSVKQLLRNAQIIFYDEIQHSTSGTSKFCLGKCESASLKIGLSATPFRDGSDVLETEAVIGPVIHSVSYSELIREGFLLKPTIYMYKLPKIEAIGNYRAVYNMAVTDNEFLTGLIKKIVNALVAKGHSVVVQTEFINHTKKLASVLGVPFLTGQERDMSIRGETIQKLADKKTMCLVSTLFEEGLDLPSLGYTVNVVGGLSNISTFQRMRSITAQEGKTTCGIIDFYHQCKYLERHSKVRKKLYKSEPEFEFIMRDASKLTIEEL